MLVGLRVEAVIDYGIGRVERGGGFDGRVADADLAIVADAQFASQLKRNPRESGMRAH
jgi:hypothetical protein